MRSAFSGYFRPTQEEFEQLWKDCIFVFDTNVLLGIYEYSKTTREDLTRIMLYIKERAWLPHHVGSEFLSKRIGIISGQAKIYDDNKRMLEQVVSKLEANEGHPFVPDSILGNLKKAIDQTKAAFDKSKAELEKLYTSDSYLDTLAIVFEGRAGSPYSEERMAALTKEGERRYEQQIPPGYKDKTKAKPSESNPQPLNHNNSYGDLIIWEQMIQESKSQSKPLILITDDEKEDWWATHQKRLIGPRPEMIEEFAARTGHRFYMYNSPTFMKYAEAHFNLGVKKEAIEEAQSVIDNRRNLAAPHTLIHELVHKFTNDMLRKPSNDAKERSAALFTPASLSLNDVDLRRAYKCLTVLFDPDASSSSLGDSLLELRSVFRIGSIYADITPTEINRYRQLYSFMRTPSDVEPVGILSNEQIVKKILGDD